MPKVSVLLVTVNRGNILLKAIESLYTQTFQEWELIVVDDSQDKKTEEAIKKFANDPRIRYFHRLQKGSIANASNFGIAHAQGEYIAILDDDDWWLDVQKLEKQLSFLSKNQEYVGCGGGIVVVDAKDEELFRAVKPEKDEAIRRRALYANPMANSTTLFRRATGEKIGNYDETLSQFADWDFWLKIGLRGKLYNFPEYFTAYAMWEQGSSFSKQREASKNTWRIIARYREYYPGYTRAILFAISYGMYACFPKSVKQFLNTPLSRFKKFLFRR